MVADPARARQILSNLLGNAVKYTMRGRIEVRLERLGDDRVRLAIADTGPGLSPDEIDRAPSSRSSASPAPARACPARGWACRCRAGWPC